MPTLDDIPTLATVTPTGDDLMPIYDPTIAGSSKVRKIALAAFPISTAQQTSLDSKVAQYVAGDFTSVAGAASVTLTTRVTIITGSTATQLVFPAATAAIRELIVINQMSGGAGSTVTPPILSSTATTLTAGSAAAFGGTIVGEAARFISNGTGWYRVG